MFMRFLLVVWGIVLLAVGVGIARGLVLDLAQLNWSWVSVAKASTILAGYGVIVLCTLRGGARLLRTALVGTACTLGGCATGEGYYAKPQSPPDYRYTGTVRPDGYGGYSVDGYARPASSQPLQFTGGFQRGVEAAQRRQQMGQP